MPAIADAVDLLRQIAPLQLAEEWDNVGLLAGDPGAELTRVLTCLTLTDEVIDEAIASSAQLVVTHHPLPFRPVQTLAADDDSGGRLWRLARAGVAVYSPHTAYDSAVGGVNDQIAERLGLSPIEPITPADDVTTGGGVGRIGVWPGGSFAMLGEAAKKATNTPAIRVVSPGEAAVNRVAVACGSGGSLLEVALQAGCDAFLTGEMGFHECLRCRSLGVGVILVGHYASERFAIETLAQQITSRLPGVVAQASSAEQDPLHSV